MAVYVYDTVPFRVKNATTLVHKIEAEGEQVDSIASGNNGVAVHGVYFIAGDRKSIATVLKATPDGSFIGQSLVVMMTPQIGHRKTIVVAIMPDRRLDTLTRDSNVGWVDITRGQKSSNNVLFRQIVSGMRPASAGDDDVELDI